jgi:hypothetical protein
MCFVHCITKWLARGAKPKNKKHLPGRRSAGASLTGHRREEEDDGLIRPGWEEDTLAEIGFRQIALRATKGMSER